MRPRRLDQLLANLGYCSRSEARHWITGGRVTIDGAVNIPVDDLRQNIDKLDKQKTYVLCCAVGQRAYIGHRILKQKGLQA